MTEPTPPRTYTDDEVNAIAAKARREAEASAKSKRDAELAEKWGVAVDQVDDLIAKAKADADAKKDDAQRAREAADAEKEAAAKDRAESAALKHSTRVERALLRAGVPAGDDAMLEDATALVRVAADADDKTLAEAIEAVKTRHPAMFDAKPAPTFRTPPHVRPPSGRPGPPAGGRDPQVDRQLARRGITPVSAAS